jgi:hypothetical protein
LVGKLVHSALVYTASSFFLAPEMIGFDYKAQAQLWETKKVGNF